MFGNDDQLLNWLPYNVMCKKTSKTPWMEKHLLNQEFHSLNWHGVDRCSLIEIGNLIPPEIQAEDRGGRHVSTDKILSAGCDQVWDQDVECRKLSQQRLRIYVQKNIMIVTHNLRLCKHVSDSVFQLHLPRSSILARAANEPSAKLYNYGEGQLGPSPGSAP